MSSDLVPANPPAVEVIDAGEKLPTDTVKQIGLNPEIPTHAEALKRLDELEAALLAKDPMMPQHLKEIHKQMIQYEELVHLLSDEQIGVIISAQQRQVNVTLTASAATPSGKKKAVAAAAKLQLSDL